MDLQQLRTLLAIAREGNFSRAGEQLHLTQPAISMQIRRLEEELDEPVLDRSARQVRLTQAGEILVARAQHIFAEMAEATRELEELKGVRRGYVTIGCSDTASRYYLAHRLGRFIARYPRIEINLHNRTTPEIVDEALRGAIDLGIALLPCASDRITAVPLFNYREIAVCANDHPLARRKRISLDALSAFPLLLLEPRTRSRSLLDLEFARQGIAPRRIIELGSVELQKELARIGLGVAIIPDYALGSAELHVVALRELRARSVGVIHRNDRPLPATARALLASL